MAQAIEETKTPFDPKPISECTAAELAVIQPRTDLPPGHWLYGKRAARAVTSGESDIVVNEGKLCPVRDAVELAVVEGKPIETKPVDEEPVEEKPLDSGGEDVIVIK